jgi:aminoglycoside phosphotransferase family enzyme/predicted kinase
VAATQEPVFALLADPATHGGLAVKRIDTHAASVFLAGDRAYKIKRAVRFPFLDYSTLEKRKAACEAELEVNRAYAPQIYRRVVAVARVADGHLVLDAPGTPVEWAVEMRRFDENCTLDHLADRGAIDAALADALGRAVASGHALAPAVEAGPWIEALAAYIEQNNAAFRECPALFPQDETEALARDCRAAYARLRTLLRGRGEQGLIRRGHGDLHLGNIALIDGRPVPFDAIEFDPLIAAGDVLYDLAFLLMDLIERNLMTPANIVLNRYLVQTKRPEDLDALAAMPLFLCVRAAIRAKVTAARLDLAKDDEKGTIVRSARTYFDQARRLITPAPPLLIAVGGLSGTGKSALARALAPDLMPPPGAVILRSDVERKAMFGVDEHERLPPQAYRPEVTARVYATIVDKARRAVVAGHSAILDAMFANPLERSLVNRSARVIDARFHGLMLETDLPTRIQRIAGRGRDASDADVALARAQEKYDLGIVNWTRVDASGPLDKTVANAKAAISQIAKPLPIPSR